MSYNGVTYDLSLVTLLSLKSHFSQYPTTSLYHYNYIITIICMHYNLSLRLAMFLVDFYSTIFRARQSVFLSQYTEPCINMYKYYYINIYIY